MDLFESVSDTGIIQLKWKQNKYLNAKQTVFVAVFEASAKLYFLIDTIWKEIDNEQTDWNLPCHFDLHCNIKVVIFTINFLWKLMKWIKFKR